MKRSTRESITRVEVPVDPLDNPRTCIQWKVVDVPPEVLYVLQERNRVHFGQAHGSAPFTIEPLLGTFGYGGCTMAARQVLNGNFDFDMITDTSVSTILKHMKQQNARQRHAIRPEISLSSFISKLKTWREYTATSPSGLHLGHYRSLIARHSYSERDPEDQDKQRLDRMQSELRLLHLRLINYALTRGYSYKRWQQVVNSMLWKEPGNHKIHRTRVIHLFEADYNLALNLKWREASLQAERNGLLYKGQYGSRPRKCAVDPVLLEVLQTEMSRITRKSLVLMNFDATSCYDRILPSLANLASRKFGVPPTETQMNVLTLEKTSYRLRTGIGMSPTGYSHCEENPIYGIGQGAGHASQTWNFISSVLLECHEEQVEGALRWRVVLF